MPTQRPAHSLESAFVTRQEGVLLEVKLQDVLHEGGQLGQEDVVAKVLGHVGHGDGENGDRGGDPQPGDGLGPGHLAGHKGGLNFRNRTRGT